MQTTIQTSPPCVAARPSIDTLVARAQSFVPVLKEAAAATEANRRVSADIMHQLSEAGLLQIMKPARFGGYEYGPSAMLRVGFELGRGCGSTAWCAMIANCNAWYAAYWPLEAQCDIWENQPENLIAGTIVPTGKAEPVDGGFHVQGKWPYASNCENSQWYFVSAIIAAPGSPPGASLFLVPAEDLRIDQDSWHMAGLQGTGSKTLVADMPIFVPAHRMIRFADMQAGSTPGVEIPDNPIARFGFTTFGATALVAPLLGLAQGALDWFGDAMRNKVRMTRPGAPSTAAENPFIQERAGRASSSIDAALALLISDLAAVEALIFAGDLLDITQRIRVRRALGFAAEQATFAVDHLYAGAGASAADLGTPIQRQWRDVNAGAHHVSLDVQAINTAMGQQLFGLAPVGSF